MPHGDGGKQLWATDWGAKIGSVVEQGQASALTPAYELFGSYSSAGPLFAYSYRERTRSGDWSRCPAWDAVGRGRRARVTEHRRVSDCQEIRSSPRTH